MANGTFQGRKAHPGLPRRKERLDSQDGCGRRRSVRSNEGRGGHFIQGRWLDQCSNLAFNL